MEDESLRWKQKKAGPMDRQVCGPSFISTGICRISSLLAQLPPCILLKSESVLFHERRMIMAKEKPLYERLYSDAVCVEIARTIGYAGCLYRDLWTRLQPLCDKFG